MSSSYGKSLFEMFEDIEKEEELEEKEELTEEELNKRRQKILRDLQQDSLKDLNMFDEHAWNKGDGYTSEKFQDLSNKLEGMDSGLYLLAAESNVGKSAVLLEMIDEFSKNPDNNLFGVYFTLDDSKHEIIPRLIAKDQTIPIGVASKPQRYQNMIDEGAANSANYRSYLERREKGLNNLKNSIHRFKIYDGEDVKYIEEIEKKIEELQIYIKSVNPKANLIVGIDSINDLRFRDQAFHSDRAKHDEAAQVVKDWTNRYDIPILCSIHLAKGDERNARPTISRIKESVEYVYEASVIWLLYNDVGIRGQSAKVYSEQEGTAEKFPIIEMDWAKNKRSSFKGRTFLFFSPEYSKVQEVDEETTKRYNGLVYEG